ncbi:hypothetical protein BJV74DRAFT_884378 [Russula compacta]|nr:hypothetical protein BJV74DRAFT_884378 [Russula compacta]
MVDYSNPAVSEQDILALRDFWHTINGIYIWEFVTNLDYEWSIIRGRRPYRWTIWIYTITRLAALMAVVLTFLNLDVTTRFSCEALIKIGLFTGYLGIASASLLIVLRIVAIWSRNKVVVAIAACLWVTNVSVMILGLVRVHSTWNPIQEDCIEFNMESTKPNILVTLASDITLLLVMLVGLLRVRYRGDGAFGIASFLWKQGLIWLLLATLAEVPPAVFIVLNLNAPFDIMFQHSMILLSIAATRMYRGLVDFVSGSTDILQKGSSRGSGSNRKPPAPTLFNRIEMPVARDEAYELSPTSQTTHICPEVSTDGKPSEKSHGLCFDNDVESAMESQVPG